MAIPCLCEGVLGDLTSTYRDHALGRLLDDRQDRHLYRTHVCFSRPLKVSEVRVSQDKPSPLPVFDSMSSLPDETRGFHLLLQRWNACCVGHRRAHASRARDVCVCVCGCWCTKTLALIFYYYYFISLVNVSLDERITAKPFNWQLNPTVSQRYPCHRGWVPLTTSCALAGSSLRRLACFRCTSRKCASNSLSSSVTALVLLSLQSIGISERTSNEEDALWSFGK